MKSYRIRAWVVTRQNHEKNKRKTWGDMCVKTFVKANSKNVQNLWAFLVDKIEEAGKGMKRITYSTIIIIRNCINYPEETAEVGNRFRSLICYIQKSFSLSDSINKNKP